MSIENIVINDIYDRISKILKNDQKYTYKQMGESIIVCTNTLDGAESYYGKYPPLSDVAELGAALAYEGSSHHNELINQVKYKMLELKNLLPDISNNTYR